MNTTENPHKTGWLPDIPDRRDKWFAFDAAKECTPDFVLPIASSMQIAMSAVEDQTTNCCVAKAVVGAMEYLESKSSKAKIDLSSRFLYYNSRVRIGTESSDSGSFIRDALKVAKEIGVPWEIYCPDDAFMVLNKPTSESYSTESRRFIAEYNAITGGLQDVLLCIAKRIPVVFGFAVYERFMFSGVDASGVMQLPGIHERMIGGHASCACGFDDRKQAVLVRNSWGINWGLQGYFWMPYSFIGNLNYACDFWAIKGLLE